LAGSSAETLDDVTDGRAVLESSGASPSRLCRVTDLISRGLRNEPPTDSLIPYGYNR